MKWSFINVNMEIVSNKKGFDLEAWLRGKNKRIVAVGTKL